MNFSKTTEYALRILALMARDESKLYSANELYKILKIPFRYLRKQLTILSKNGLLVSKQGKNGGYRISKNLNDISILDIIIATGENKNSKECFFGFQSCAIVEKCVMHDKWMALTENLNNVLSSTKLADLKRTGIQNSNS